MFHLRCLCFQHAASTFSEIKFGLLSDAGDGSDISEVIKLVQKYSLSDVSFCDIITDASSLTGYMKNYAGNAIKPGCVPRSYVDFFDKDQILINMVEQNEEIRANAAAVDEESSDVFALDAMCIVV